MKEIFKLNNEVLLIGKQVKELNDKNNFDLSIINLKDKLKVEIYKDSKKKKVNFKNIDSLFLENKNKISSALDLGKLYKNE
jgi:hypothetical protein